VNLINIEIALLSSKYPRFGEAKSAIRRDFTPVLSHSLLKIKPNTYN
jgi:hypothetical protein